MGKADRGRVKQKGGELREKGMIEVETTEYSDRVE